MAGPASLVDMSHQNNLAHLRRGQENTSSVRLRKKRDVVREEFRKNRRSGEFGYFSSWEMTSSGKEERRNNKRQTADWSYIPFPTTSGKQGEGHNSMETLDRRQGETGEAVEAHGRRVEGRSAGRGERGDNRRRSGDNQDARLWRRSGEVTQYKQFGPIDFPPGHQQTRSTKSHGNNVDRFLTVLT